MSETKGTTPGPWSIAPCSDRQEYRDVVSEYEIRPDGTQQANWIAQCDIQEGDQAAQNEANAELIVRAVNAHDDLVAALKAVAEDVCGLLCPSTWRTEDGRPPCHPKCQAIRAALEKAK